MPPLSLKRTNLLLVLNALLRRVSLSVSRALKLISPLVKPQSILKDEQTDSLPPSFSKYFNEANLALCAAALHPAYGQLVDISPSVRDATWSLLLSTAQSLDSPLPDEGDGFYVSPPFSELLRLVRAKFEDQSFAFSPAEDPLEWWKKPRLQPLHPLLRYLWAIPASSSSAERLFSALGHFENRAPQRSISTLENLYQVRDYQRQTNYNYQKIEELISPFREEEKKKQKK